MRCLPALVAPLLLAASSVLASPLLTSDLTDSPANPDDISTPAVREARALMQREGYRFRRVPSDGIEAVMKPGSTATMGIPETIQGIWWITVNPLGDLLTTVGGDSRWDPETRTIYQNVYGTGSYSFHTNEAGIAAYASVLRGHLTYALTFTEDEKFAEVGLIVDMFGARMQIPSALVRFTLRWVGDGEFIRESWILGQRLPDYKFRRVVRSDGTRDPAYAAYLLNADKFSYVAEKVLQS